MRVSSNIRSHLGFRLMVSVILVMSVGVNLAVFALVNALWLRPLPVKDPDRIVTVLSWSRGWFTPLDFELFEELAGQVSSELGFEPDLRLPGSQRVVETVGVTSGFFALFGLEIRGRGFTESDDTLGAEATAVISHRLWLDSFEGRMDVLGRVIATSPVPVRVVGIAPPGFEGARRGERTEVWVPRAVFNRVLAAPGERDLPPMSIWARLKPGDTLAEVDRRVKESYSRRAAVAPLGEVFGTPTKGSVLVGHGRAAAIVAGLAALVLLGGCAAIAALVLVHYERRRMEFSLRAALGASRRRLMLLLTGEMVWIGAAGTVGAILSAELLSGLVPRLGLELPGGIELGRLDGAVDWRGLAVGVLITTTTLALASCVPILRFTGVRIAAEVMRTSSSTTSTSSQRIRQGLLASLVAATVVVLVSAGLFIRAVQSGYDRQAGFDVDGTVFATAPVVPPGVPVETRSVEFSDTRAEASLRILRNMPSVTYAAIGLPPLDPNYYLQSQPTRPIVVGGIEHRKRVGFLSGTHDLLNALGVDLVAGRHLTASDAAVQPAPTVLTETLARELWPNTSPLGQMFGDNYVVVGIARDFAFGSLSDPAQGVQVVARSRNFGEKPRFVIRTGRRDQRFLEEVLRALREANPGASSPLVVNGRNIVSADLGRQRLGAWFFSGFGVVALLVGAGSVFGLVSYLAESRRREFGVRLALGASHRDVVRQGISVALVPSVIGLLAGLALSFAVSHVFATLLVGVSPLDWITFGAVSVGMLSVSALAALTAAVRLRSILPIEALKSL